MLVAFLANKQTRQIRIFQQLRENRLPLSHSFRESSVYDSKDGDRNDKVPGAGNLLLWLLITQPPTKKQRRDGVRDGLIVKGP